MRRKRHKCGFTLIEMSMVMITIGILAAIAIPRYSASLQRYYADHAAQRLIADLALAQTTAKTTTRAQTITFNITANSYQMNGVIDSDSASAPYIVNLSRGLGQAKLISASFAAMPQVTFDRYGMPGSGGTIVIQVGDLQRNVVLDANSAKATVQ